ncbi:S-layer homology domain-containing protein [Dysosmobacter sp.]|uniref:S-layer homology domain-containing protein n=1 Tax=Dysosmobacter sp. TaxID=2591382 RepID=UPI00307DEF52
MIYKVTISEGGSAKFLRIDITKRTPHAVKYVFASPAPETVPAPVDPAKYTETSSVTLLDPAEKSVTGTHEGRTGLWTFDGWTVKGDHTNTQISQADKKFIMPDEDVTVTGTWTFTSDPTPVYVYFKTVNTKNELVKVESGVTYNANGSSWATLGKLVTATTVTPKKKNILGAEVKTSSNFVKHDSNKDFDLDWISEWVDLKRDNGAAGYESEVPFGTHVCHLDGQVNVCKLSYDANRPAGVTADVTVPDSAYYLPNWNAPVSTDDPTLQDYNFGGWYKEPECVNEAKEKVAVAEDTVLYAKWTPLAQPTADLIDDNITIKHGVNGAPADDDDTDTTAHIVKKDAKISYQATLDMQNLEFGVNPEHADTVFKIKKLMQDAGTTSLWEFMMGNPIVMFTGSEVNLHVKFSDNLDTSSIDWSKLSLISDWFRLADGYQNGLTKDSNGYWTIPCVIKAEKGTNNSPIINLSGITLSLTDKAQGKLNSNTALDITSEGYIDGTIKISTKILNEIITYELSLIGKSKDDPVKNTAKLKLAVPTYTVTYTDGANGSAFKDQVYSGLKSGVATPAFNGTPTRSGYTFNGWTPAVAKTVTGDATYTATWSQNSSHDDDDKYFFAIQKVDAQDGHALNGAKFELYQLDKNDRIKNRRVVETRQQSSKNGIALFGVDNKNSYDGIWYYAEVTAPEGYVLDRTEYEINAKDFSDSLSTAVRDADTVRNYRGTTPDLLNDSDHFAYVIGYMDGNVRPYGLISRAETTTIFFRLLKDSVRDGNLLTSNTYTDVADDYWANTAISTMTGLGIVQGRSTTTFDPKAPITRAQFAAICARFDTGKSSGEQTFSDIQGHWAEKYIERAAELGWIKGFEDGTFRPDAYITRAQAMTMINRVLNRIPEDESDLLPGMNVWPDCNPGDWFYLTVQEATNSHDFEHKAGSYETWTRLTKDPDWTRYEN